METLISNRNWNIVRRFPCLPCVSSCVTRSSQT